MKEISIYDVGPVRIGQAEDAAAGTGCTVFIHEDGMHAGLDVRGGGPASRETYLLSTLSAAQRIHGVVLAGGSAFGLAAAGGVMKYLEEHGFGFDVGVTRVPLVVQSGLFDLTVGDPLVRPDEAMGYEAARRAFEEPNYRDGNFGAGCGATVGKLCGMERCMKTGMGSYAVQLDDLKIGAVVALNALGDIFDWKSGKRIAGMLTEDGSALANSPKEMAKSMAVVKNRFVENGAADSDAGLSCERAAGSVVGGDCVAGDTTNRGPDGGCAARNTTSGDLDDHCTVQNTTLGVIITNARFHKGSLCKIAGLGHDGYARSIRPVHTSLDGDSIYALSVGDVSADREVVGTLAAEVISEAIIRAVQNAESAYGFPSARELGFSLS